MLKYIMPTKYNTNLITKSYNNFINHLTYSIFFNTTNPHLVPIKKQLPNYNPNYTLKIPQQKVCQQLDQPFKFDILKKAKTILHILSNMPQQFKTRELYNNFFITSPIYQFCNYFTYHQLVILVTDKNLSCTVAPTT